MKKTIISAFIISTASFGAFAGECNETDLAGYMQDLKEHSMALGKSLKAGDVEASKHHLEPAMEALRKSFDEVPYQYADGGFSEEDRAAYRESILQSMSHLENIEMYLYDKDIASATKELKGLASIRKQAHSDFKEDC